MSHQVVDQGKRLLGIESRLLLPEAIGELAGGRAARGTLENGAKRVQTIDSERLIRAPALVEVGLYVVKAPRSGKEAGIRPQGEVGTRVASSVCLFGDGTQILDVEARPAPVAAQGREPQPRARCDGTHRAAGKQPERGRLGSRPREIAYECALKSASLA